MDNLLSRVRCIQFILLRVYNTVYFHSSVYVVMPSFLPRPFTTALEHGYDGHAGIGGAVLFLSQSVNLPVCFCIACLAMWSSRLRLHERHLYVLLPPADTDLEGCAAHCAAAKDYHVATPCSRAAINRRTVYF